MIFVGYEELNPNKNFPRMADCFETGDYKDKSLIIHYLRNGIVDLVRVSRARDVFTHDIIQAEVLVMHDSGGKYEWSNLLAYYVDKYNLRLPKEFEAYILGQKDG